LALDEIITMSRSNPLEKLHILAQEEHIDKLNTRYPLQPNSKIIPHYIAKELKQLQMFKFMEMKRQPLQFCISPMLLEKYTDFIALG
jgi:hypothetical protein